MSFSSLNRMSVPVPGASSNQGLLMPKLKYRFRVLFQGFGVSQPSTELTKQVFECSRPKIDYEPIRLDVYNSTIKLAGRHSWTPITISVRDDVSGIVSKLIGEQQQRQMDYYEQSSAASGIDYKFTTRIQMLDGGNGAFEPVVLETWELYGCFLQSTDYTSLGYGMNEEVRVTMSIEYDNAIQVDSQGNNTTGVGIAVGRTIGTLSTG